MTIYSHKNNKHQYVSNFKWDTDPYNWLTYFLTYLPTYWLPAWLTDDWPPYWLTDWLIDLFIDWLTDWLRRNLFRWALESLCVAVGVEGLGADDDDDDDGLWRGPPPLTDEGHPPLREEREKRPFERRRLREHVEKLSLGVAPERHSSGGFGGYADGPRFPGGGRTGGLRGGRNTRPVAPLPSIVPVSIRVYTLIASYIRNPYYNSSIHCDNHHYISLR